MGRLQPQPTHLVAGFIIISNLLRACILARWGARLCNLNLKVFRQQFARMGGNLAFSHSAAISDILIHKLRLPVATFYHVD